MDIYSDSTLVTPREWKTGNWVDHLKPAKKERQTREKKGCNVTSKTKTLQRDIPVAELF